MRVWKIAAAAVAGVAAWAFVDLNIPTRGSLREFDPMEVARIETDMWRSYYERKRGALFFQLAGLLRRQFHMPFLRSHVTAFHAAKAAIVFQEGSSRVDYGKAVPYLIRYYEPILPWKEDVEKVAHLELEWWIVHRERNSRSQQDLELALAELQGAIYREAAERFREHAHFRAEAMLLRDRQEKSPDWAEIRKQLEQAWVSLWRVAQASG